VDPVASFSPPLRAADAPTPRAARSLATRLRRSAGCLRDQSAATVYLFDAACGQARVYPLDREANRALTEAQKLYLEVNLADPSLARTINEVAIYPDGESLERTLPPALMTRVDAALERYKLPRASAVRMKPWMLGQTLLLLEATRLGYDPTYATEMYLLAFASAQRKDVFGLETLAEQFALFDGMPAVEQQRFLEEILTELGDARTAAKLDALVDAWAHADARGLEIELTREKAEATAFARDVLPRVIDERNRTMAEKIVGLARAGTTTFVAVGALHLVGPDGIVEILRGRGFAVRQL
jgi:uncharacterized protein YbaP (TraB family)